MKSMRIESIDVFLDSLEATVCCKRGHEYVSGDMAMRLNGLFPHLGEQVCVSAGHRHFGEEIEGTELPHLLEHVTIELMVEEARMFMPDEEQVFLGNTSWKKADECSVDARFADGRCANERFASERFVMKHLDNDDDEERAMRVCITFEDDFVALGALKQAAAIIEWAGVGKPPSPDVEHILQKLHGLRMD